MGRYDTLNPDTQDQVDAMIPAIAKAYMIDDVKELIPEDIRMRAWDCEKRDHIKERSEEDPRNWGVQFLRDIQSIARLLKGDRSKFQTDLRAKVEKRGQKHPWCKLIDVTELKKRYLHPDVPSEPEKVSDEYASEEGTENDSYFEELVEPPLPPGTRRKRNHEVYEARSQAFPKPKKRKRKSTSSRLRRDSEGWERREKQGRQSMGRHSVDSRTQRGRSVNSRRSVEYRTPGRGQLSVRRPKPVLKDENDESDGSGFDPYLQPGVPMASQLLAAELEFAEAELKVARLKKEYVAVKQQEMNNAALNGAGTHESPHSLMDE